MRLKQLLGIILPAMVTSCVTAGWASQLTDVRVVAQKSASVVTILANGAFTHTEYRPTDNLMLVDLAGVSVSQQDANLHPVSAPGVESYRVLGYKSATGVDVARLELHLVPSAEVRIADVKDGVELFVDRSRTEDSAVATPMASEARPKAHRISRISDIEIVRDKDGLNVEVAGTAEMTARTMKLSHPDRLVIDIPNSLLEGHARDIRVNSDDVKSVRAARYQSTPPTTRVVVDLATMHDFELLPVADKLVVKVKSTVAKEEKPSKPSESPAVAPAVVPTVAAAAPPASKEPAPAEAMLAAKESTNSGATANSGAKKAPDVVIVRPTFTIKKKSDSDKEQDAEKAKETDTKVAEVAPSRADQAASHFVNPAPALTSSNRAPFDEPSASLAAAPASVNAALAQQQMQATAAQAPTTGCTGGHYTGEPVSFNVKDLDIKDFFRVIKEISGLNVVLDPSVHGSIPVLALDDVPWDQALAIVLNNNGLECQLQGNVLRIATLETLKNEAEARRAQQEAQALAVPKITFTRYLSYGHAKDVAPIVKKFLSPRGDVIADERSNALIIEDIPSTQAKIDSLLPVLDRKTPEVEIEARVVAATRNFARDIGTQLGFGFASGNNAFGGLPVATNDSPLKLTPAPVNSPLIQGIVPGTIPLFSNFPATANSGLSFINNTANFRLDFVLSLAESRGLAKVLSRPRVVTQNNIEAVIRQGQRIPVVTAAQLGGPPTVTYVDAFLRLTVTPQITAEKTIFLKIDVENTTADFSRVTGAQLNPTLNTAQSTTEVLISDGGTVVIGGVIATTNAIGITQTPVLGSIPILGNLFKRTNVSTQTNELIFFITPKIIQT